jgi:hypothetical protein
MKISISSNIAAVRKSLTDDFQRKQLPFATAAALNDVAFTAQRSIQSQMATSIFDKKPTAFTTHSIAVDKATKSDPTATVRVKDAQAEYLKFTEAPGTRTPLNGGSLPVPVGIPVNASGNIPRKRIAQLAAKPRYFIATVKGTKGLYQRPTDRKQPLKLMATFVKAKHFDKPKLKFAERVDAVVKAEIEGALQRAMAKALASAKR